MARANSSITVPDAATGLEHATQDVGSKHLPVIIVAGEDGYIRGSKDSYIATYKLATDAAVSALTFTFGVNGEKQFATLHHAASATKVVRIRRVELYIAASAATILNVELRRLNGTTLPATGNPVITPIATNPASGAAEATCLALPTTAGSFPAAQPFFSQEINLGANTALTTTWPPDPVVLWPAEGDAMDDMQDLILRNAVAEGIAASLRSSAAVAIKATIRIMFTEHTP